MNENSSRGRVMVYRPDTGTVVEFKRHLMLPEVDVLDRWAKVPMRPRVTLDEADGVDPDARVRMIEWNMLYATSFKGHKGGVQGNYEAIIIAPSWEAADVVAAQRGLGETVYGMVAGEDEE